MSDPETRAARRVGMAELDLELSGRDAPKRDQGGPPISRETPNQVRTGGGGQATPDDLPDAPVPWERSDARSMIPAEHSDHERPNGQRRPSPDASPERSMDDPDKGTGSG
jgi:hypothetical protein